MDYLKEYERWCTEPAFDEETKKELLEIKGNDEEIKDRFYKELRIWYSRFTWCNRNGNK